MGRIKNISEKEKMELFETGMFNSYIIAHLKNALDSIQIPVETEKDLIKSLKKSLLVNRTEDLL